MTRLQPLTPIYAAPLLRPLLEELLDLLRGLDPAQWEAPTVAGDWRVRDVAAHLLDGELRKIAAYRDGHMPPPKLADPLLYNALPDPMPAEAISITGDRRLAEPLLRTRSIVI